ncbi:hypothetical protein ACR30L_06975 [Psychromonas sp. PT13]|uniref:hypothetical protein n=1 Tax=Psychromonas sp. PT13 TaxID=3439547 RepID=UPI003EB9F39D
MNKSILASALISVLLSGCGSGGGGSNEVVIPVTHTWQIVQLKSVAESSLDPSCIIYANSNETSGNVITAYKATSNYNILYHNADGSISEITSAESLTNGKITITESDIPAGGYVSLEEVDGSISNEADVFMFGVEKSLLTDLVINVRQSQTGATCYAGSDYRDTEVTSDSAVLYVDTDGLEYYQTSYDQDSISGKSSVLKIPVESPIIPLHDVLVTAFSNYDSDSEQKTGLSYFAFAEPDEVFDSSDTDISFVTLNSASFDYNWSYSTNSGSTISLNESAVFTLHDDIVYYWQPLYDSFDLTIADSNDVTNWSVYLTGSDDDYGWDFEAYIAFDSDTSSNIDFALPELYSLGSTTITSSCNIGNETIDNCIDIDGSYDSDDFTVQRTHVELTDDDNNLIYQSIYSSASDTPILLESSQYELNVDSIENIEINLVNSDVSSENAIKYLMAESTDEVAVGDDASEISAFQDANGYVPTGDERDELELAMFEGTTTLVKSAK